MPDLGEFLDIGLCPHCGVAKPALEKAAQCVTRNHLAQGERTWRAYACRKCGGVVIASAPGVGKSITAVHPAPPPDVSEDIPARARTYLQQARDSLNAPAGAVMLAASSVDSMLKERGLSDGVLYARIKAAVERHLITEEMGAWAHDVRLDANDQRHSDDTADLPSVADAQRAVDFAGALAEFLFVLPARVRRGRDVT